MSEVVIRRSDVAAALDEWRIAERRLCQAKARWEAQAAEAPVDDERLQAAILAVQRAAAAEGEARDRFRQASDRAYERLNGSDAA